MICKHRQEDILPGKFKLRSNEHFSCWVTVCVRGFRSNGSSGWSAYDRRQRSLSSCPRCCLTYFCLKWICSRHLYSAPTSALKNFQWLFSNCSSWEQVRKNLDPTRVTPGFRGCPSPWLALYSPHTISPLAASPLPAPWDLVSLSSPSFNHCRSFCPSLAALDIKCL